MNKKIIFTLMFICSLPIQSNIDSEKNRLSIKKRTFAQDLCMPVGSIICCWSVISALDSMPKSIQDRVMKQLTRFDSFGSKSHLIPALIPCLVRIGFFTIPILGGAKIGFEISERFRK